MDRTVALKVLSPTARDSHDSVQRFQREVQAAARLIHPNIVTAFDAGECRGAPYLVMWNFRFALGSTLSFLLLVSW